MAQKRINDLTLRTDADATCNFGVDDPTQSWRVTLAQIQTFLFTDTAGIISRTAKTVTEAGDLFWMFDNAATAMKKISKYNLFKKTVSTSKTTTYTATAEDEILLLDGSSASWTLTLPTAVGIAGKVYRFIRTDNNPDKIVTVDGNSAEAIGAYAVVGMYTQWESLTIVSDGANWQILDHHAKTPWYSTWTPTVTALGTVSGLVTRWRRDGLDFLFQVYLLTGTPTSAAVSLTMPFGFIGHSTQIPNSTNDPCGTGATDVNNNDDPVPICVRSDNKFYVADRLTGIRSTAVGSSWLTSGKQVQLEGRIPIDGWIP